MIVGMSGKTSLFLFFLFIGLITLHLLPAQTSSYRQYLAGSDHTVVRNDENKGKKSPAGNAPFELNRSSAIQKLLDAISSNRLYRGTVSYGDIEKAVLQGIVSSLDDPYASIVPIHNREKTGSSAKTGASDMGLIFGKDEFDRLEVVSVLPGSPAEKAGIIPGDNVLRICGKNVAGVRSWQASSLLEEEEIEIVVENAETGPRVLTLHKQPYRVKTVEMRTGSLCSPFLRPRQFYWCDSAGGDIAWIKVHSFLGDTTREEWSEMVAAVHASDSVNRIVFDLRDNGGGDNSCISLLGDFFLTGEPLVCFESLMGESAWTQQVCNTSTPRSRLISYPIVVLVNNRTASLAEIAAAALRDNRKVPLVGETTFGKGTTQTWIRTGEHFAAHLTTGRWLSPSGYSVDGQGLVPDLAVKDSEETSEKDEQLIEAVRLLTSR